MFGGLIAGNLARAVADRADEKSLAELRLRIGRPPLAVTVAGERIKAPHVVSREELDGILLRATNMSLYSVSEELLQGYIPYNGLRIGVGGEGVSEGGKLLGVKNISYLVIRAPHQVKNAADEVYDRIVREDASNGKTTVRSTLVIAPPRGGKTTLLRELARRASDKKSTVIIDERFEIACAVNGRPSLDVGDAEVVSGIKKCVAYENVLRAMSPEVLVTDEICKREEADVIADAVRAGVKVFASAHGESLKQISESEIFSPLVKCFETAIELSAEPIGKIVAVREL